MSVKGLLVSIELDLHNAIKREVGDTGINKKDLVPDILKQHYIKIGYLNEDGTLIKLKEV